MKKPSLLGIFIFSTTLFICAELAGYFLTFKFPYSLSTKVNYLRPKDRSLSAYHQKYGYIDKDSNLDNGRHRTNYKVTGAAFGCSFTFGDEVTKENSWSFLLTQKASTGILNFGQRSWGFDQALLLYEDVAQKIPPNSYVFLGIISDHSRRIQNVYRRACSPTSGIYLTKPRFTLQNQELVLLENPIAKKADLTKLSNWKFLEEVMRNDQCYSQRLKDWGLLHGFPYFRTFLRALYFFFQGRKFDNRSKIDNNSLELRVLTEKILRRFKMKTQKNQHTPVILHYPEKWELKRFCENLKTSGKNNFYSNVTREISTKMGLIHYSFLDKKLCKDLDELFMDRGHLSPRFHSIISDLLFENHFKNK